MIWARMEAHRGRPRGDQLKLYVDGKLSQVIAFNPADYDISTDQPLRIGFGQTEYFAGKMADVRLYNRALAEKEIEELALAQP